MVVYLKCLLRVVKHNKHQKVYCKEADDNMSTVVLTTHLKRAEQNLSQFLDVHTVTPTYTQVVRVWYVGHHVYNKLPYNTYPCQLLQQIHNNVPSTGN